MLALGCGLSGCGGDVSPPPPPAAAAAPSAAASRPATVRFTDVAAASGVVVRNLSGTPTKPFIVESMGAGACWLDYDRDGTLDLFVVQGSTFPEQLPAAPPGDVLYRGLGDGRFADVTAAAGLGERARGGGCAIGDVDNDGLPDLYVLNHGRNQLWLNRGDGSFRDATDTAGVGDDQWGVSAAFADFDRDGDLDLFVANYVVFDWDDPMVNGGNNFCLWHGIPVFCGPRGLKLSYPVYYRNQGDGRFADATDAAGFRAAGPTYGLGVALLDYDRDGDLDIYTANDARPNHLWSNRGDGTFEEVGFQTSAGLSDRGKEQAGMGVDAGDYDDDGWMDIFVTNFSEDTYSLYHNDEGMFSDVSFATGVTMATFVPLGWGARFFDYDADGDLDLLAVNGHVYPQVAQVDTRPPVTFQQPPNLLQNRAGHFTDVADEAGMGKPLSGRGAAVADMDDDGDLDVVIVNLDDVPTLYRNSGIAGRHFIGLSLTGTVSSRDPVGAVVIARAAGLPDQHRQAVPSGSYSSSSDPRVYIGLGAATRVSLEIRWPSGQRSQHDDLPVDRYLHIVEGEDGYHELPTH